ncbi:VgrG-related protein [Streptomyces sp. H27-H1]|uniref:VgrG-related protein n=1 Tax=Streptomyces sp. H27-H1 TaxID=2996461 RepID=UPI0022712045|nr:VgrG-related protein [Streptomyces sp. H27-H1]MCY0931978.1 VgrG-related protein [Streptomyces sp. H27-H1]
MPALKPPATLPGTTPSDTSIDAVRADVRVGPLAAERVSDQLEPMIIRVVVDTHLHLPDMFEITFADDTGLAAQAMQLGYQVEIRSGQDPPASPPLIRGEITSLEAVCEDMMTYLVVRGYDLSHALQRARRTRTFVNTKDSDIAARIAAEAKLKRGTIEETKYVHRHLAQIAQTDWDFLQARARANGFEMGVTGSEFHFRRASAAAPATGLKMRPALDATPTLTFKGNLISFLPRLSATERLPRQVEVRTWDEERTEVVVATAPVRTASAGPVLGAGKGSVGAPAAAGKLGSLAGATDAHLIVDHPVGAGADIAVAAEALAQGVAERMAGTAAEAEGRAIGSSAIQAGRPVQVEGVPQPFCRSWMVTQARHTFCEDEGGYYTDFFAHGSDDLSLPGMASSAQDSGADRRARGMMCGIVTNVADPTGRNRVRVRLPLLSPDFETDWVRVVQPGGNRGGAVFVPEVGDEVLVAFEWDDVNRPIVIGGMRNGASTLSLGGPAVERKGETGSVMRRGLVSSSGNRLAFVEVPPNRSPLREQSSIVLATDQGDLGLTIDKTTGQVLLTCKPQTGRGKGKGDLTISTDGSGTVTIDSGPKGSVNVTGGDISVRASRALNLESDGQLNLKGQNVKISGRLIELN